MRCGKRRTRWRPGPALTAQREPPHGVVDAEPNEPAKQEFGLEPLDQPPPLMENLQQHRQQEALGRDRGRVKRLISRSAIQFKGSGWYVTDYARGSNRGAEKSDNSGSAEKSESKAEPKTDSKSDSKAESKSASEGKEKKKVGKEK